MLKFLIKINSRKEKVWQTLWNKNTYTIWANVFTVYSNVVTDWREGSKILFLSLSGYGMYGTIIKKTPFELMSFKHLGVIKRGEEQPIDKKTKKWSGAMENYYLKETNGVTLLEVELDVIEDHLSFFRDTFPIALEIIKKLSEKNLILKLENQSV